MKTRILAVFWCAAACAVLFAACGVKADGGIVPESSAEVPGLQSELPACSRPPSQAEPAYPEVSGGEEPAGQEPEEPDGREESANYIYDEADNNLLFTDFGLQCTVSPKAIERIELKTLDAFGDGTIIHIHFNYKSGSGSYRMFLVSIWDAEEWDNQSKEMGPLPTEIARSADKKKAALHAPSVLAADSIADNVENQIFREFIKENEEGIIGSLKFV